MEDVKYLYFMDSHHLCRLNLTEFERNKDDPPSFEIVFNFFEANLPLGMGLFTLGDTDSGSDPAVYVAGGEKSRVIPDPCCPWDPWYDSDMQPPDTSYGDGGLGRKADRLEPNSSSTTTTNKEKTGENAQKIVAVESPTIPDMISPKPNALTANIHGEVYDITLGDNASGSDLAVYVDGGEKTSVIPDPCFTWGIWYPSDMHPLDTSYGDGGLGRKVYRLEPNSSTTTTNKKKTGENAQKIVAVESSTIPDMISPKPNALTAKIDGKVYVLANSPYFYIEKFPSTSIARSRSPTFEVYDPVTNSWEILENCPFYPNYCVPNALFVLNHYLLVRNMHRFFIYDVDARVWSDGKTDLIQRHFSSFSSVDDPVPHPYLFGTVATYEDLTIAYTGAIHGVVVYFPPYNVGPKHQSLGGLDVPFEFDDEHLYDVDCSYEHDTSDERIGNIFHLGGGKMCFFCAVCGDYAHVIVTIFQLKVQRSGVHYCRASADVLCSHSYHLHETLGYFGYTRQIFIMGELFDIRKFQDDVCNASSKRQRQSQLEVLDVDASSKRLQTNSHW